MSLSQLRLACCEERLIGSIMPNLSSVCQSPDPLYCGFLWFADSRIRHSVTRFPRCQALSIRLPCSWQNRVAQSESQWRIVRVDKFADGLSTCLGVATFQVGKASQTLKLPWVRFSPDESASASEILHRDCLHAASERCSD